MKYLLLSLFILVSYPGKPYLQAAERDFFSFLPDLPKPWEPTKTETVQIKRDLLQWLTERSEHDKAMVEADLVELPAERKYLAGGKIEMVFKLHDQRYKVTVETNNRKIQLTGVEKIMETVYPFSLGLVTGGLIIAILMGLAR